MHDLNCKCRACFTAKYGASNGPHFCSDCGQCYVLLPGQRCITCIAKSLMKTPRMQALFTKNPCGEIPLGQPEVCNRGYRCIACEIRVTGHENGICGWCLEKAEFKADAHDGTIVGRLMDDNFYCLDCAGWWETVAKQKTIRKIHIGWYSQSCCCCSKIVVAGTLPFNAYKINEPRVAIGA